VSLVIVGRMISCYLADFGDGRGSGQQNKLNIQNTQSHWLSVEENQYNIKINA
jgi:hypothetical protein